MADPGSLPAFRDQPVLVVGGGPVGQSAALLLARWGLAVVVLERLARRERVGSKSICQHRDVLDIWEAAGAGARIAREGVTWQTARTFFREHELFQVRFRDRGRSAFPPFVNISQSRTEEILGERIAAQPLVQTCREHTVTDIEQDEGGVTVTCSTPDGRRRVRGSYAILCAGGHADELRGALGVSFPGRAFDDEFLICDIRAHLEGWQTERRFYFDPQWNPGRQVLIHPCPGGTYRIDWQVAPGFDLAAEEASGGLDARVRAIIGPVASYEIVWRSVYRFHARAADRMRVGRVLLAGDVAHLMAPFGARGLNSGVADAENAAWKIAFGLRGWGGEHLLESYHVERSAAARENLDVTSATMRFLVPQDEAGRAHRRATLERALHDESARAQVDSGRLYEPFWYADSPLTTPDVTRPLPARPPVGEAPVPAPGVLLPDVPVTSPGGTHRRLRELAREGLLVLVADGADTGGAVAALRTATTAPVLVVDPRAVDAEGRLADTLGLRPQEVWVVRPDAHVAAVVPGGDGPGLVAAVRRALGHEAEPARSA